MMKMEQGVTCEELHDLEVGYEFDYFNHVPLETLTARHGSPSESEEPPLTLSHNLPQHPAVLPGCLPVRRPRPASPLPAAAAAAALCRHSRPPTSSRPRRSVLPAPESSIVAAAEEEASDSARQPNRLLESTMEGLLDKPLNPNKLLKEQFVSNLTGSSLLEIAALSTIVPAVVVLRKWSSGGNIRRDSVKKNDDALRSHKDWVYYFSSLAIDYLTVVLPILLIFTVLAEWAYMCAVSLVIVISFCILFKRSQFHLKAQQHNLPSLRTDISSYRVSVILVTCLSILAVDFKIFPRRYAKAETYGSGIMDLGVGSFVVANAMVSRQARNITTMRWKASLRSISPLVFLGFARLISTSGVDYQVHVGEYGVHWNFFFTLAAISVLTSIVRIHPKYCGIVGMLVLAGYQVWLSFGLNEYLISNERSAGVISQNKEGVYSIFGYWGMYLIGVSLGYYMFFDTSLKCKSTQVVKVWVLAASCWILAIILDSYVERVSRRMCNFAYVMLVFGQNFQVISILTLAGSVSYDKNLILEYAFNQNMLGLFLLANILTGLINLSVDTLSASSFTAFMILSVYNLMLCVVVGLAQFCGVRMKFW
uniref:Uncharacterized protein n=2 Tax=Avena sativa TaxID=4498 RepID=A0ACD5WXA1_AVESA